MEQFVAEHEPSESFKAHREAISGGTTLSELVREERRERF